MRLPSSCCRFLSLCCCFLLLRWAWALSSSSRSSSSTTSPAASAFLLSQSPLALCFFSDRVMLGKADDGPELRANGTPMLMDDDGTAVIVHENADTYGEEAGAGDRIACGVIEARG